MFKAGDKIRMKEDCGGSPEKGEVLTVKAPEILLAVSENGLTCTCLEKWELVETTFPADSYEWLKEGDLVDVHEDSINFAGQKGLKIGAVEKENGDYVIGDRNIYLAVSALHVRPHVPDEVEEMTLEQVCKELGREIKIVKK